MSSATTGRECAQSARLRCSCSAAVSRTSIEGPRRPAARPMSAARRLGLAAEGEGEAGLPEPESARGLGCGDGGRSSGCSGDGDVAAASIWVTTPSSVSLSGSLQLPAPLRTTSLASLRFQFQGFDRLWLFWAGFNQANGSMTAEHVAIGLGLMQFGL
jgi:hypothetical protein